MTDALAALVGQWDMYAGPIHSEIELRQDGSYEHRFMQGSRRHWGAWGLETQYGQLFIVMHLAGAEPMAEPTMAGWMPIAWPALEAWPITTSSADHVQLGLASLVRRQSAQSEPLPEFQLPPMPPLPPPTAEAREALKGMDLSSLGRPTPPPQPIFNQLMQGPPPAFGGMPPPQMGGGQAFSAPMAPPVVQQNGMADFQARQASMKKQRDAFEASTQNFISYIGS